MTSFLNTQDSFHKENSHEFDEDENPMDEELNDENSQRKVRQKRANCFPVAWLLFISIVLNIQIRPSAGLKCTKTDIKYKDPKTGKIVCGICPDCAPSQQFSIPCGSTVDIGTGLGQCQYCPEGTFSNKFDKKPCRTCTTCTNKVYLRNCTKHHNALCGRCKPGYKYDNHTFDCHPISKLQPTPTTPTAKSTYPKTTAKKTPVFTATEKSKAPSKHQNHTFNYSAYSSNATGQPTQTPNNTLAILKVITDRLPSKDKGIKGSSVNPWMIAMIACLSLITATVTVGIVHYFKKRAGSSRQLSNEEAGILLCENKNGKSTSVSKYMNDSEALSHKNFGEICHRMNAQSQQLFKSLVCGLGIQPVEFYQFHSGGKGDFNQVLDTLKSSKPKLTLDEIAQECEKNRVNDVAQLLRKEDLRLKRKEDENVDRQ